MVKSGAAIGRRGVQYDGVGRGRGGQQGAAADLRSKSSLAVHVALVCGRAYYASFPPFPAWVEGSA
jgi:hypothetical protein